MQSNRSIRVLHLVKGLDRGGAEVLLSEGLSVADRTRFEFSYGYFLPGASALVRDLQEKGATVHCFDTPTNAFLLLSARRVAAHIRASSVDLVHAHLPLVGVVARLAGRLAGVPVVYTEHSDLMHGRATTRWLTRATWRWQDHAIAVSSHVRDTLEKIVGNAVPINLIRNGVNCQHFSADEGRRLQVRERLGIDQNAPVVGVVSVFRPEKRLDIWLQVARLVYLGNADARFILVGDGSERRKLEILASEYGLGSVVHFVGRKSDPREFIDALDVFLMTSAHEALGIAPLEAMSMKVPVVATKVGGLVEVVNSREVGLLREFGDVQGLADSVCSVLDHPELGSIMGSAGRRHVEQNFSIGRMQSDLEQLYQSVLSNRIIARRSS